MKGFIQIALAATLVVGATAQPHAHQHLHQHVKKHEVAKRDAVTVTSVVAATVTEYVLDGAKVDAQKAEKGIKGGDFIVVGSTTPTFTPPPPSPPSSSPASVAGTQGAQFFELKPSSSAAPPAASPAASSAASPVAAGLNAPFPTGDDAPSCSVFPSAWGAVAIPWLKTGGWASLQKPSNGFLPGIKIQTIDTPITGTCAKGMFCAHACPPGYMATQWPETSQGQTGQSVGGLWCDDSGKLRLTRPNATTICAPGAGGVVVKSSLPKVASICKTVYPGTENMVIPTVLQPGGSSPLANPDAKTGFWWEQNGVLMPTSAQYYINPLGLGPEDACVWKNDKYPDNAGNWAPTNLGIGKDVHGVTYIGLFQNLPTSTAALDYNVRITGDVTVECKLVKGVYSGENPTKGCTTAVSEGGTAVIEFYL